MQLNRARSLRAVPSRLLRVRGTPFLAALTLGFGLGNAPAPAATVAQQVASSPFVEVIEYYHAGLDHYFMTADAAEAIRLDAGALAGWRRTGYRFVANSVDSTNSAARPVCRFYGRPEAGLDSHFYSADAGECAQVSARFAASWTLEAENVFRASLPDATTGACTAGTIPVHRLFNNRLDANHRYTSDSGVRARMIAMGYVSEGSGSLGVAFCALAAIVLSSTPSSALTHATQTVAGIAVTQISADTFDFAASASAGTGATIVSHNWSFGDGTTATGSTALHRYSVPGIHAAVLNVTDSKGEIATATFHVTASVSATTPSRPDPTWRRQLPKNVFVSIPNTAAMGGTTSNTATLNAWNGLAAGPTTWWSVANGGHEDSSENKVIKIDLAENVPRWTVVHPGSSPSNIPPKINLLYYYDGLPASRHTYYAAQYIAARNRVMLFSAAAVWGNGNGGGPVVDGFRLADNQWDAEGTWSKSLVPQAIAQTVTKHPTTEDVYAAHSGVFAKWTQATATWSPLNPTPRPQWQFQGSLIDASRNRWVYMDGTKVLGLIDLTTQIHSTLPLTGVAADAPFKAYNAIVHDLDNDRYLTISDERVYAIDPATGATSRIATVAPPVNGVHSRFAYFRELGGVAYLPSFASPILFMPTR